MNRILGIMSIFLQLQVYLINCVTAETDYLVEDTIWN